MESNNQDDLCTHGAAARELGLKPRDLLAAIEQGELPAARVGGRYLVRLDELRRILSDRATAPATTIARGTRQEVSHADRK